MPSLILESIRFADPAQVSTVQHARHVRSSSIVSREIGGETVVVPICRGVGDLDSVYAFNALGTELWRLLAESRTEPELVRWVTQHYAVSEEQALADVQSFLADLREVGLVKAA
jgi:hypothetical protein